MTSSDSIPTRETEVVIVGAGFAGLVSAVRALEFDADVVVLEKGSRIGGTGIVSGGGLTYNPDSEPYVDAYEPRETGVAWLEDLGITVTDPQEESAGEHWDQIERHSFRIDPPEAIHRLAEIIESQGGEIHLNTPMKELEADDRGRISGVIANSPEEGPVRINAPSVILATGGFSGDAEQVQNILPPKTQMTLRRDPWTTGDGFSEAKKLGARVTQGMSKMHGHSMAGPPAEYSTDELREATMYFETKSIALDEEGTRFTDESKYNIGELAFIEDLLFRTNGEAFLIIDEDIYDSVWPHISVSARVDNAERMGAPFVKETELDGLARGLDEYGVDGDQAVRTIQEFNEAVENDQGEELSPPRRRLQTPIDSPPYYAIGVRAGVSYFYGGLDVNANAQVVSKAESTSNIPHHVSDMDEFRLEPINGLYATGVEVGRPDGEGYYATGLCLGLATGRIAGKHATEYAKSRS